MNSIVHLEAQKVVFSWCRAFKKHVCLLHIFCNWNTKKKCKEYSHIEHFQFVLNSQSLNNRLGCIYFASFSSSEGDHQSFWPAAHESGMKQIPLSVFFPEHTDTTAVWGISAVFLFPNLHCNLSALQQEFTDREQHLGNGGRFTPLWFLLRRDPSFLSEAETSAHGRHVLFLSVEFSSPWNVYVNLQLREIRWDLGKFLWAQWEDTKRRAQRIETTQGRGCLFYELLRLWKSLWREVTLFDKISSVPCAVKDMKTSTLFFLFYSFCRIKLIMPLSTQAQRRGALSATVHWWKGVVL